MNVDATVISDEDEVYWAQVYIQGSAALKPSTMGRLIVRLTKLKLQKPTQAMDEDEVGIFLEDIAEMLCEGGFCYHAVDKGIKNYLRSDKGAFFPTYKILEDWIKAEHYKMKRQIDMIGTLLETKKQKVLTKGEKK